MYKSIKKTRKTQKGPSKTSRNKNKIIEVKSKTCFM